ncbi:hypothetical protein AHF37_02792 [Paragonimus kellicotti]|nr:hypothetical protein AHF37_02792 [Paragonimus kellicotti]
MNELPDYCPSCSDFQPSVSHKVCKVCEMRLCTNCSSVGYDWSSFFKDGSTDDVETEMKNNLQEHTTSELQFYPLSINDPAGLSVESGRWKPPASNLVSLIEIPDEKAVEQLSNIQLRMLLSHHAIEHAFFLERSEYVERVKQLWRESMWTKEGELHLLVAILVHHCISVFAIVLQLIWLTVLMPFSLFDICAPNPFVIQNVT